MASKRVILEHLNRNTLRDLADTFEVEVEDRRVHQHLVDALAASRRASLSEILATFSRDELKELCRALDLSDRGRAKADLMERIRAGRSAPIGRAPDPPRANQGRGQRLGGRQDQGQGPGPVRLHQPARQRGCAADDPFKHVQIGYQDRNIVNGVATFDIQHTLQRLAREGIGGETVQRLGGEGHHSAGADTRGRAVDVRFAGSEYGRDPLQNIEAISS